MPARERSASMSKTDDAQALLTLCLQDLCAGERMLHERLPAIAEHADAAGLRECLGEVLAQSRRHAQLLDATGRADGGPNNLWMRGILDDAERDTKSIEQGPLLDVAMIGALRKAGAAKLVSYETAIAMAEACEESELVALTTSLRDAERSLDDALAELLKPISGQAPSVAAPRRS